MKILLIEMKCFRYGRSKKRCPYQQPHWAFKAKDMVKTSRNDQISQYPVVIPLSLLLSEQKIRNKMQ